MPCLVAHGRCDMAKDRLERGRRHSGGPTGQGLLDTTQAARHLGVQATTLVSWRCSGRYDLSFIRVGRCIRYRPADLDAWLEGRTVRPAAVDRD